MIMPPSAPRIRQSQRSNTSLSKDLGCMYLVFLAPIIIFQRKSTGLAGVLRVTHIMAWNDFTENHGAALRMGKRLVRIIVEA